MEKIKDSRFELVDSSKLNSEVVVRPNISYWKDAWRRLKKNPVAMGALFVLIGLILMSVLAPIIRNMDNTILEKVESDHYKKRPDVKVGDIVKLHLKIKEGN